MDKEKLIEELKGINEEINKINSKYYENFRKEINEKEKELRILHKPIYKKYIWEYPIRRNWIKTIKPSVKEGIKRGLGIKYFNLIYEGDIVTIVKQLIKEDLEKTKEKEIIFDIKKLEEEQNIKHKEYDKQREILEKRSKEIEYELNKEEIDKENIKEEKRKEVGKIIDTRLSEFIDKIRKEVEKGLLLDALNK